MYIIGENIHIISQKVKDALKERDAKFFQELAVRQVEGGAQALDLNLGPRKKDWEEVFPWMVETVEAVVDVPLSFDSTNLQGIEAGLKKVTKAQPIINSTSAEPERLANVPPVAKQYDAKLVALTMGKSGIPVGADERVTIALEQLIPRMLEIDYPIEDLIIDPLVLTVSGCQEYCPELIEAVRTLQYAWDPPPAISVGLSNVSNAVPHNNRELINHVYLAMLMGSGLQMMIADPLDERLWQV
ncbi:MAG: dihydropteroate synthase, partial [Pseudomonadales bacterium]|nr:dihydropteroate synthase [Pseudomonadales bacterium]NIX09980.1 dihydropteroate synthase [Pseudomonadales bacterium]